MASVRPERRPATKVTLWDGPFVVVVVVVVVVVDVEVGTLEDVDVEEELEAL